MSSSGPNNPPHPDMDQALLQNIQYDIRTTFGNGGTLEDAATELADKARDPNDPAVYDRAARALHENEVTPGVLTPQEAEVVKEALYVKIPTQEKPYDAPLELVRSESDDRLFDVDEDPQFEKDWNEIKWLLRKHRQQSPSDPVLYASQQGARNQTMAEARTILRTALDRNPRQYAALMNKAAELGAKSEDFRTAVDAAEQRVIETGLAAQGSRTLPPEINAGYFNIKWFPFTTRHSEHGHSRASISSRWRHPRDIAIANRAAEVRDIKSRDIDHVKAILARDSHVARDYLDESNFRFFNEMVAGMPELNGNQADAIEARFGTAEQLDAELRQLVNANYNGGSPDNVHIFTAFKKNVEAIEEIDKIIEAGDVKIYSPDYAKLLTMRDQLVGSYIRHRFRNEELRISHSTFGRSDGSADFKGMHPSSYTKDKGIMVPNRDPKLACVIYPDGSYADFDLTAGPDAVPYDRSNPDGTHWVTPEEEMETRSEASLRAIAETPPGVQTLEADQVRIFVSGATTIEYRDRLMQTAHTEHSRLLATWFDLQPSEAATNDAIASAENLMLYSEAIVNAAASEIREIRDNMSANPSLSTDMYNRMTARTLDLKAEIEAAREAGNAASYWVGYLTVEPGGEIVDHASQQAFVEANGTISQHTTNYGIEGWWTTHQGGTKVLRNNAPGTPGAPTRPGTIAATYNPQGVRV